MIDREKYLLSRIRGLILESPGINRTTLRHKTKNLTVQERDAYLATLIDTGRIVARETIADSGRKITAFFPLDWDEALPAVQLEMHLYEARRLAISILGRIDSAILALDQTPTAAA